MKKSVPRSRTRPRTKTSPMDRNLAGMDSSSNTGVSENSGGTFTRDDEELLRDDKKFSAMSILEEKGISSEMVLIFTKDQAFQVSDEQLVDYECPAKLKEAMSKKCRFKSILIRNNDAYIASRRSLYVLNLTSGRLRQCPYTSMIEGGIRPRIMARERRIFCSVGNRIYRVEKSKIFRVGIAQLPIVRFAPMREDNELFEFCYSSSNNRIYHSICIGGNHVTEDQVSVAVGTVIGSFETSIFIWTADKEAIVYKNNWTPAQKYLFKRAATDFINSGPTIYLLFKDSLHVVNTATGHVHPIQHVPKGKLVLFQQTLADKEPEKLIEKPIEKPIEKSAEKAS